MKVLMKKVWFLIKRILFYLFIMVLFYGFILSTISFVLAEPNNGYSIFSSILNKIEIIILGVLGILVLLLITYIVIYIKKNKFSIIEILLCSFVIMCVTLPNLYSVASDKYKRLVDIDAGIEVINNNLAKYFNKDDYSIQYVGYNDGCHFICTDIPTYNYEINNTKLDLNYKIIINANELEIKEDNLIEDFLASRNIEEPLTQYFNLLEVLPSNINAYGEIKELDFGKLNSDSTDLDILSNSVFDVEWFNITLDKIDKDEIIKSARLIYDVYGEYLYEDYAENKFVNLNIIKDYNVVGTGTIVKYMNYGVVLTVKSTYKSDISFEIKGIL